MARKDRRDHALEATPAAPVAAGALLGGAPIEVAGEVQGASVAFQRATLEILVVSDDLVRLSWGPDDEPVPWATADPIEIPARGVVEVDADERAVSVTTRLLRVEARHDGVRVFDAGGSLRYRELPPLRRGATRTFRRQLRPGERILGFGEQAMDPDLRGRTVRFFNRDPGGAWGPGQNPLYCSIPVSLSRHDDGGALAFHENSFDATMTIGERSEAKSVDVEIRFAGGMVRTWVAIGDERTLLQRYTGLTGRHRLPPRWSLGYHHSRWGYGSTEELASVIDGFADRSIPLSVLHLDIDYMDQYRVFSVDEERFGGLLALSESASERGARLVTIIDPAIRRDPGYDLYDEGVARGFFVAEEDGTIHEGTVWPGWAVFPDFSSPAVREWWATHYARILDHGIAGIWHDMNEPTSITLAGDRTLPRSARHDNEGRGGDHREVHNVYGLLMNRAGTAGLLAARPERRPFIVSRSGWAGMQRDAWNWTADVEASPEGLRQQLVTFIGLGLSGVAFTGSDIGGFSGIPTPELYLRWLELGVVSPFCRTHSVIGAPPREPWCWPEDSAEQVARLISLRYRLLPYLYTLAEESSRTGAPLLRPLWWAEANPSTYLEQCADAVKVGDSLVFALMTHTKDEFRAVALPPGTWWLWRAIPPRAGGPSEVLERHTGGGEVVVEGRLGQPLLFIKAGAIVPLDDAFQDGSSPAGGLRSDHAPTGLSFHVFPDQDGVAVGANFDDAGDGDGPGRRDVLNLDGDIVTWSATGSFARPETITLVLHGIAISAATADGQPLAPTALRKVGDATVIHSPSFDRLELVRR